MPRPPRVSPIALVRVGVAILLGIHGVYRVFSGGVGPFGEFLSVRGFPFGPTIAWSVTLFEIGGGLLLVVRQSVVPIASAFIGELVLGMILVHSPEGWFVVGGGRNGVE